MMPNPTPEANCAQSPANRSRCTRSGGGRPGVAVVVAAICIVLAVVWGEVWAIEHGTELAPSCSAEYATAFDGECAATTAPIAVIH